VTQNPPPADATVRVGAGFRSEFPTADPSAAEAGANLVRTSSLWLAELARRRRDIADLSASGFQALAILEGAGEPLPATVLADRLLVTTASITSLLDTLVRRGLVERRAHPKDRRKILVALTPAGAEVVDRVLPLVHATATDVFTVLSPRERETLVGLLGRVQQRLGEIEGVPLATKPVRRTPRRRPR
jgi:DNA-binding MarR family transcriptional regulator